MPAETAAQGQKGVRILGCTINHFSNVALLWQAVMIIIFGTATKFFAAYDANGEGLVADVASAASYLWVSLAVVVGLGYFFTVSAKYNWSTIGFTLVVAAMTLQWAQLVQGFWDNATLTYHDSNLSWWPHIELGYSSLLRAEYIVATILIALGAMAGRVSALQALAVAFWGTLFATANHKISTETHVMDAGGSMYIHIFGAVFGLAASWALTLGKPAAPVATPASRSRADGALVLLGTVLLFITLPVWNNGLVRYTILASNPTANGTAVSAAEGRSFYNTVAALASSVAGAFLATKAMNGKFSFEAVQRAAIAGAAGVAATAPIVNNPWGPMLLGLVVGFLSVVVLQKGVPGLKKIGVYDGAGVLATSFVPGVIGCVASAIAAAGVKGDMGYGPNSINALVFDARTALQQGGYQMGFGLVSILFALIAGLLVGFVVRLSIYEPKAETATVDDAEEWAVTADEEATAPMTANPAAAAVPAKAVEAVTAAAPAPAPAAAAGEPEVPV